MVSSIELYVCVRIQGLEAGEIDLRIVSRAGADASRRHIREPHRVRGWTTSALSTGLACLEHLVSSTTALSVRARTRELEAGGSDHRRRVR